MRCSQEDYLREFAVLMTEKGVVAVSDPQQIAVYDFLCGGKKRPSDIADALGFPSSSLHFVLDKMVDSGIIVRSKPDPSKKEVYYSILALRIAGSADPTPERIAASQETFRHPDLHYSGLASVANMLESYTGEIGLEHGQLRARYVKDLAASFKDDIGTGQLESVMQGIKDRFTSLTGFRMSVFALNPPTIVFEGDRSMTTKMDMLSLFVMYMMENATGRTLAVKTMEDFSNEEVTRFKVVYDRADPEPEPYVNTSLPQMADPEKFMVVEIDGGVALIMNDIQTRLIDAIYERPLCVTDVVNAVGMPRSTVTTNLLRMVEEGVVSVFYSESGALYYGLSCSILMKRVRRVSKDPTPTRDAIRSASKEGRFMEGYMLYLLASLKELGFDTDYMMVVLGAKYMRAAGQDGPKNFDAYFGKMSDIAKVVGLSLSVVSVYPLTIGIAGKEDVQMAPAMTFVKGMAHQGLEMASSGIFVRVSEETPEDMKVSFKEIYPSLSMNPAAAAEAEALASPVPTKKRTSSVRDALRNRSAKADGRPIRTVRYITGVAMVVFAVVILALAMGGNGDQNIASAESYLINVDPSSDITLYDVNGEAMSTPFVVRTDSTVTFTVSSECVAGVVDRGIAVPLTAFYKIGEGRNADGSYTISLDGDLYIQEVRELSPSWKSFVTGIYDFGAISIDASSAASYDGYIPMKTYSQSGSVWTTKNAWVSMEASKGDYLSFSEDSEVFIQDACVSAWRSGDIQAKAIPADAITVSMDKGVEFMTEGILISGDVLVKSGADVNLRFVSTDGPVKVSVSCEGSVRDSVLTQDRNVIINAIHDVKVAFEPTEIY